MVTHFLAKGNTLMQMSFGDSRDRPTWVEKQVGELLRRGGGNKQEWVNLIKSMSRSWGNLTKDDIILTVSNFPKELAPTKDNFGKACFRAAFRTLAAYKDGVNYGQKIDMMDRLLDLVSSGCFMNRNEEEAYLEKFSTLEGFVPNNIINRLPKKVRRVLLRKQVLRKRQQKKLGRSNVRRPRTHGWPELKAD